MGLVLPSDVDVLSFALLGAERGIWNIAARRHAIINGNRVCVSINTGSFPSFLFTITSRFPADT